VYNVVLDVPMVVTSIVILFAGADVNVNVLFNTEYTDLG
jgi:hypothetical protein